MDKKIIRYGVVGVGRGGYLAGLGLDNPNCKLVAACDKDEARLKIHERVVRYLVRIFAPLL